MNRIFPEGCIIHQPINPTQKAQRPATHSRTPYRTQAVSPKNAQTSVQSEDHPSNGSARWRGRLGKSSTPPPPNCPERFNGACCDMGAQRSCICRPQAKAYWNSIGTKLKLTRSCFAFKFGDGVHTTLGTMEIRIPTPDGSYIAFDVDVISADVPLLLGLDILGREQLVTDTVDNVLDGRRHGWKLPLTRNNGHMYLTWQLRSTLFTRAELCRIHLHFFHSSARKLFNILKLARPHSTKPETHEILKQISKACNTCQVLPTPLRFRVTLHKSKCVFNHEFALDLMWLEGISILHVVDTHTNFSSAIFLSGKSTKDVWNAFIICWAVV